MNLITVTVGQHRLIYKLHDTSLAASWVNHWYSVDPVTNTHRQFGPQRMDRRDQYLSIATWIKQPGDHPATPVHRYQWPCFRQQWEGGDLVMGWHSASPQLRYLYSMRDIDAVKNGQLARVDSITPAIQLYFGEDKSQPRVWNLDREILWWLYEHDLVDRVPHLGFEITCHADPIIGKLIDPKHHQVLEMIKPGDQITSIQIYPPACF